MLFEKKSEALFFAYTHSVNAGEGIQITKNSSERDLKIHFIYVHIVTKEFIINLYSSGKIIFILLDYSKFNLLFDFVHKLKLLCSNINYVLFLREIELGFKNRNFIDYKNRHRIF
jgi:hypothetical protein